MTKAQLKRKERNQTIMDLYGDLGKPAREIAEVVGCTPKTVWHVIRSNRSPEENEAAMVEHLQKVHKNFGRCK